MPRIVRSPRESTPFRDDNLVAHLSRELKSGGESSQPLVDEEHFKTGAIRILVLWDRWHDVHPEKRSEIIVEAYRRAEGEEFAGRIALVNGMTFPEAHASGLLPYQVIAAPRPGDPVTAAECRQAMIDVGASMLFDPGRPRLFFTTEGQAEAFRQRLAERLPGSEPVWRIIREVGQGDGFSLDLLD
jgi:hypothetical protein